MIQYDFILITTEDMQGNCTHPVCTPIIDAGIQIDNDFPDIGYTGNFIGVPFSAVPPEWEVSQVPTLLVIDENDILLSRLTGNQITKQNVYDLIIALQDFFPNGDDTYTNSDGLIIGEGSEFSLGLGLFSSFGLGLFVLAALGLFALSKMGDE